MGETNKAFRAMISSDWNECLAPSGPFDPIGFTYPELTNKLESIFRLYTGNKISLGEAADEIARLLPRPLTKGQMDSYLDACFTAYKGVPELIRWASKNQILFMINTTASIGLFQRVFAKKLLPPVPALSGHDMTVFDPMPNDPEIILPLHETVDKEKNTWKVALRFGIRPEKIIIIGDSGGDGPHFEWGASKGCRLVASMAKTSLQDYCNARGITIDAYFGIRYKKGQKRDFQKEMEIDFTGLKSLVLKYIDK